LKKSLDIFLDVPEAFIARVRQQQEKLYLNFSINFTFSTGAVLTQIRKNQVLTASVSSSL